MFPTRFIMLIIKYIVIAIFILQVFDIQRFKRSEKVFLVQAIVMHSMLRPTINPGGQNSGQRRRGRKGENNYFLNAD